MQWRGVRRLSVCPSVNFCANRFYSQTNGRIATKLSQDGLQVSMHPGCAQGQGQGQRSRDTGTFVLARKSLLLAGKWPDRHQTCTRCSPGKPASKMCSRSRSRQRSRDTRTFLDSWNELLRHWRSGFVYARWLSATMLEFIEPRIAPFDPPTPKTLV